MMANEKRLIDANEVLAGIETFMQCYAEKEKELTPFWVKVAIKALEMVRQLIKEMPTVDAVEVVHGRWIDDRWTKWQCDKCHSPSPAYGYPKMEYVKTKYCPHCGAKMDGGNEDG